MLKTRIDRNKSAIWNQKRNKKGGVVTDLNNLTQMAEGNLPNLEVTTITVTDPNLREDDLWRV